MTKPTDDVYMAADKAVSTPLHVKKGKQPRKKPFHIIQSVQKEKLRNQTIHAKGETNVEYVKSMVTTEQLAH